MQTHGVPKMIHSNIDINWIAHGLTPRMPPPPPFIIEHQNYIKHANWWCCGLFQGERPVPIPCCAPETGRFPYFQIPFCCTLPPKCKTAVVKLWCA